MYKVLSIVVFLLLSYALHAQSNFVPGYIVRPGNDSLRGEINDLQWKQGPYSVEFRQPGAPSQQFTPNEIRAFGFGNHHYRSERVLMRTSPIAPTNKLINEAAPAQQVVQVFLKQLLNGKHPLYIHRSGNDDPHFFIRSAADTLVELLIHRYLITNGSGYLASEVLKYRQQLGYFFSDCPGVQEKLASLAYTEKAMIRIFQDYNQCVDSSFRPALTAKGKARLQFFVHGGYASTSVRLSTDLPDWEGASLKNSGDGFGTLGLELSGSRPISRAFLFFELGYRSFTHTGSHTKNYTSIYRDEFSYSFDMSYLAVHAGGRYEFMSGYVRPFVCGGLSFGIGLDQSGSMTRDTYLNGVKTNTETTSPLEDYRKLDSGILVGAGTSIGRFRLQANIIVSNGYSEYNNFTASLTRLEGRLGYRIF